MTTSRRVVPSFARTGILRGRRGAPVLACLSLLTLAGLFNATGAMGGQTHPFLSEFTGSDTPDGSLGTPADKVSVRQSTGDVYVIDKAHGVVDTFDASGAYLSQIGTFSFSTEPDIAVDNSATATEGRLYVLPEFQPLSAYDPSGTLLFQIDGSTTPDVPFGDACGTAVVTPAEGIDGVVLDGASGDGHQISSTVVRVRPRKSRTAQRRSRR